MKLSKNLLYFLLLIFISCSSVKIPETSSKIDQSDLFKHLSFLASDDLKGRGTGTPEIDKAADYLAKYFKSIGLQPKGSSGYFQTFKVTTDLELLKQNSLIVDVNNQPVTFELRKDYQPTGFSANGLAEGNVVFAGYGIEAEDLGYNDYANIDVKDKIVLMMRYSPEGDKPDTKFGFKVQSNFKVSTAKSKGAKAVILFTGPNTVENDRLISLVPDPAAMNAGIPVVSISTEKAKEIFEKAGKNLLDIQKQIDSTQSSKSFEFENVKAKLQVDLKPIVKETRNVIAFLEGNDPELKNEIIVIGAHYDHLGMGGRGSLAASKEPQVHNGADDNASGTTGLLELAEYFASKKSELKRSILFIAFSGEELGLLGSKHFVDNPTVPLEKIKAMINMDMIGRMNENKLTVYGTGTSPKWKPLLNKLNSDSSFKLNFIDGGFGPSDHSSFYAKNIPVLFFFTGTHQDYHKPSDDFDKINYPGMEKVLSLVSNVVYDLTTNPEKIEFTKVQGEQQQGRRMNVRVYVGTIPDYSEQVEGFKIAGVNDGSPAEKAGLKAGDIIIKFGDKTVKNVYDYMYAMQGYKAGDEVEVVVLRNGQEMKFKVVLGSR
ncbi:MAG: M20/M25/M40 family metallo-hydrolase [Ignavibacteria bacterium]|nr:M20/M25/M40 family metallo-hydrolase [Ignavibacteria bacterium]